MVTNKDFCSHFRLNRKEEISTYIPRNKRDQREKITVALQRIAHLIKTQVWIDESKICNWASKHPDHKISALFVGTTFERKLIRCEKKMVVEKPSIITTFNNAVSFIFQFINHPITTGAILPSSKSLAKEIVSEIPKDSRASPRLILEVGPGTGIFTDKIIKRMNPQDELHLVEFDKGFCQELKKKYQHIPNVKVFHADIATYNAPEGKKYDFVVSGLPLNGFRASFVQTVFNKFSSITKAKGKISYFEYLLFPKIKKYFSNESEASNMEQILKIKNKFYTKHRLRQSDVYLNIPAARVIHHQLMT